MGEMAEDCYDRVLDELDMMLHHGDDPDYPLYVGRPTYPRRPTIASLDDFDDLDV